MHTLVCQECEWKVKKEKTKTGQVGMTASAGKRTMMHQQRLQGRNVNQNNVAPQKIYLIASLKRHFMCVTWRAGNSWIISEMV